MSKRYRLLKDLPHIKSGAIFEKNKYGNQYDIYTHEGFNSEGDDIAIRERNVENNPEWFEEVKEPSKPKRIEVMFFSGTGTDCKNGTFSHVYTTTKPVPYEKLSHLKKAFEAILNNDNLTTDKAMTEFINYNLDVKYTQEEMDKAMESAFWGGKYGHPGPSAINTEFKHFSDYLKWLKNNQ